MTSFLNRIRDAAAGDFVVPFQDDFYGLGVDAMLLIQDAGGKGVLVVVIEDGYCGLQDDGAGVEIFVDEVDSAAGEFYAVVEGLLLGFEAGEGGEERGMDIQNALGEGGYEEWGEETHVACEANEIDFVFLEDGGDLAVVGFALEALGGNGACGNVAGGGAFEAGGARFVADDDGDFGVGDAAGGDTIGEGFEVGAATAEEDADAMGHK